MSKIFDSELRRARRRAASLWAARLAPVLALVALLEHSPPAMAQSERDQAAELFRRGVAAAREERWVAARRAFERAYELLPRPEILINLAAAQVQTDQLVEAQRAYREIVASPGIDPRFRAEAERALVELDREIPRIRITIDGLAPGHRVVLDDTTLAPASLEGELSVNPGPHTVVVTHGDEIVARAELTAERGRTVAVPMTITHTPGSDADGDGPSPLASAGPDPLPQLVAGGVLAAVGLALGIVDLVSIGLEGSCAQGSGDMCSEVWALDEGPMIGYAVAGIASLAAGIGLLIWGATMSGTGDGSSSARLQLRRGSLAISF